MTIASWPHGPRTYAISTRHSSAQRQHRRHDNIPHAWGCHTTSARASLRCCSCSLLHTCCMNWRYEYKDHKSGVPHRGSIHSTAGRGRGGGAAVSPDRRRRFRHRASGAKAKGGDGARRRRGGSPKRSMRLMHWSKLSAALAFPTGCAVADKLSVVRRAYAHTQDAAIARRAVVVAPAYCAAVSGPEEMDHRMYHSRMSNGSMMMFNGKGMPKPYDHWK